MDQLGIERFKFFIYLPMTTQKVLLERYDQYELIRGI